MDHELVTFLGMTAVVASAPMRRLLEMAAEAARSEVAVLITGESGSGKEIIARAVHHFSCRNAKPWVDVSCAALPEHLVETELFGYERGAFSGGDSIKQGLFELAAGGAMFLDEIGELAPRLQVKLLRVLDGVPYYRLGGTRKVASNVRIIAATTRDLEKGILDGQFRSDLYHRLSQVHLRVPPLRERIGDIAPLANYFLRCQRPDMRLSAGALEALVSYDWPGNIRELRNVVVKAAALATGDVLEAEDLPFQRTTRPQALYRGTIDSMERGMIFSRTGGHLRRAAGLLGNSSRTLTRKLRQYQLENPAPAHWERAY